MKKMSVIILLLCVVLFSACQTTSYKEEAVQEVPIGFFEELPFSSYITVQIGDQTFDALLDTGDYSTGIILSSETIEELGLTQEGAVDTMSADVVQFELATYNVPEMKMGNGVLENVVCLEDDMQMYREMTGIPHLSAIIGLQSFQSQYNICISYKEEKLYLYEKDANPDFLQNWAKLPMTNDSNLFVDGTINDETYTFCLDTQTFIVDDMIYEMAFENHPMFQETGLANIAYELDGLSFESNYWYMEVPYADEIPIDFFLGYAFFAKNDVFIDFEDSTVYIEK